MSQSDTILDDADRTVAASIRMFQQVGEALRARRSLKLQVSQQEMYAEQARLNQELGVARPYLTEGLRDHFWKNAEAEDMGHMLGIATRYRDVDPLAHQVYIRALREIDERYGPTQDIELVSLDQVSEDEIRQATPELPGEEIPVSHVKEGEEAAKEPVPQWVSAWAEDFRKGQAKSPEHYQALFPVGDEASAQAEANRAHLDADHARADLADVERESGIASPEVAQAKNEVVSAEARERAAQTRRDKIGVEAAKASELKEVSFPESATEGIKHTSQVKKTHKPKPPRKLPSRTR
ncbi:hypothetical protein [Trueperella pecoris]|uniref:Uncharacterized protein n=1 Tax=Trueperella pecoris TaxID=2733571 RepID=A0A7M1QWD9_9ACTO|nr:hypothetical protein [Trueperella pecoris]QOR45467.1 hypothetical protein INS88_09445 [Trueperella pecoris]